jgi:hypothetical protein
MRSQTNVVKATFAEVVKRHGFTKSSDGWYKNTADAILVVNLQRSSYGPQYYVNLAVWLRALGEVTYPKEYQCHIRLRATHFATGQETFWERQVFDLESDTISDSRRAELIRSFLGEQVMPTFLSYGSLETLRRYYRDGRLRGVPVAVAARQVLEGLGEDIAGEPEPSQVE